MSTDKKKKGKKVRVPFRRNRSQPARDKSWTRQFHEHGFAEKETVGRQSLMPKGDLSRRRTIIEGEETANLELNDGTVVVMRGLFAEVDDGSRIWPCTVRRVLRTRLIQERHPVAVGDRVRFRIESEEEGIESSGVICNVYERHSQLTRRYGGKVHVIAANVDQVLIVTSTARPAIKPHLIDRYLVAAHAGGLKPVVCINKIDLESPELHAPLAELYHRLGYRVIQTSAKTSAGLDDLVDSLRDQQTVVVGQSGVGKSSLLNAIQPGLQLAIQEVSRTTEKGRHTTTTTQLLKLDFGGYVVDTPGIRSFEMASISPGEYELYFTEFVQYVPHCRFPDCTHLHENDCAVQQAVVEGLIDQRRYESYRLLMQEGMG